MGSEWQRTRFAEVCEHSAFGPRFAGELYAADGNVATLRTTDISADGRIEYETMPLARLELSRLQQHALRPNDLVITRSGRIGTAALFEGFRLPVLPGAFLIRFRLKSEVADPLYYRYFFNSPSGQELLTSVATGSVQQNLNITSVHGLEVPVPPLPEQRAIAHILGTLDDKIELNRRMSETLEAMARALFKSWFVDFDPVRAKAEGRDAGLPQPLADLFPARLVDSELGEIPEGWDVRKLGDLLELAYGKALKADERQIGPIPVYGSNGQVGWHNKPLVTGPGIVVGRKGNPGVITWVPTDFFPIDTTFYVIPKLNCQCLEFLFFALRDHDLGSLGADSAVPGLNRSLGYMSDQVLPPESLLDQFARHAGGLEKRAHGLTSESASVAALRDALLPKLISGELRVRKLNGSREGR
jgi:type I restriction enzyme S subunit